MNKTRIYNLLEVEIEKIYIMSSRGFWGVYKSKSTRAIRRFEHRDQAFHLAATRFPERQIVVMTKDGDIDFVENPKI